MLEMPWSIVSEIYPCHFFIYCNFTRYRHTPGLQLWTHVVFNFTSAAAHAINTNFAAKSTHASKSSSAGKSTPAVTCTYADSPHASDSSPMHEVREPLSHSSGRLFDWKSMELLKKYRMYLLCQ